MTSAAITNHGLEHFSGTETGTDPGIVLTIRADLGQINLRGDANEEAFVAATEKVLEQSLPVSPNTISSGDSSIFWLGPNEWLILAAAKESGSLLTALENALSGIHAAVNDLSGGQVALTLAGGKVRELLAKGCTIDLHPREFRPGMCAQSGLAKATVTFGLPLEDDGFVVIARRSFADYLVHWLQDAADEYGIRITDS